MIPKGNVFRGNIYHETKRQSHCGGAVGGIFLIVTPGDQETILWWGWGELGELHT